MRSRLYAVEHESAQDHRRGSASRDAKRQQRDQRAADRGGRRGLGRDDALGDAAAHLVPASPVLRLHAVTDERCDRRPRAGDQADDRAEQARPQKHPAEICDLARLRQFRAGCGHLLDGLAGKSLFQPCQYLADTVGAHHHHQEFDAVRENRRAEGEPVGAIDGVRSDRRDEKPDRQADQRIGQRAAPERDDARQPEQQDCEILRRRETQCDAGERLRQERHDDRGEQRRRRAPRSGSIPAPSPPARVAPWCSRPTAWGRRSARRECGTGWP